MSTLRKITFGLSVAGYAALLVMVIISFFANGAILKGLGLPFAIVGIVYLVSLVLVALLKNQVKLINDILLWVIIINSFVVIVLLIIITFRIFANASELFIITSIVTFILSAITYFIN